MLEQLLLVGNLDATRCAAMASASLAGVVDLADRDEHLGRDLAVQLHILSNWPTTVRTSASISESAGLVGHRLTRAA
jgi:hypothetical protein